MVLLAADRIGVLANATEVDRLVLERDFARLDQVVLDVSVAQVPAVRRTGHARAVAVPVQQIEGGGFVAEQVVVDTLAQIRSFDRSRLNMLPISRLSR